jgi:hypothetical protein
MGSGNRGIFDDRPILVQGTVNEEDATWRTGWAPGGRVGDAAGELAYAFTTAVLVSERQQPGGGGQHGGYGGAGWIFEREPGAESGANPAGLYYTAIFHLADGTVDTQYWVVPAAATATLAAVQAQLMPAAQAVQTVSKAYVDQAIAELWWGEWR